MNSCAKAALALLFLAASAGATAPDFHRLLLEQGLSYNGAQDYKIEISRTGAPARAILARGATARLRLQPQRGLSPQAANERMREDFARLAMMFAGDAAYPGVLTKEFSVPEELRPEIIERGPKGYKTFLLFSTKSLTFGAGARDLIAHRAAYSHRYCGKTLIRVEIFHDDPDISRQAALEELERLQCR